MHQRRLESISTKSSNLFGCLGCLFPLVGFVFLALAIFKGAGWLGWSVGGILLFLAIPLFAKAHNLEMGQLDKQRESLSSIQPPVGNLENTFTYVSSDALTRVTIDEQSGQIFCWRAVDGLGKPLDIPKAKMSYTLDNYGFHELEAIAIVENSDVIDMSYTSTNIPMLEYIKKEIVSKLPKNTQSKKINTLALVIQIRNWTQTFYQVNFVKGNYMQIETDTPAYEKLVKEIKTWFSTFNNLLTNQQRQETLGTAVFQKEKTTSSIKIETPVATSPTDIREIEVTIPSEPATSYRYYEQEDIEPIESSLEDESVKPVATSEKIEDMVPFTEATTKESKELSYFEKLVAENKRQLHSKGPSEKE
ncbi:DUF4395 domain-containing protein [Sporosarcina aquimarina]|uniref:DUF4395 domain-containing protein n=1 Tax=Sporosarcina aquimarina TaxID=114975 RepID=UPI00203CE1F1|nr:DUF4395 domain-containing protein [Sporosarcina aquimarina]MCM3758391.1 DUF4395 domain-containing protein [Sporosarcina aquimarina]